MSASVLQRSNKVMTSASAPKVPIRLSRMISSFRSRVSPPSPSKESASPSSCIAPVSAIVAASASADAGIGATLRRMASQ